MGNAVEIYIPMSISTESMSKSAINLLNIEIQFKIDSQLFLTSSLFCWILLSILSFFCLEWLIMLLCPFLSSFGMIPLRKPGNCAYVYCFAESYFIFNEPHSSCLFACVFCLLVFLAECSQGPWALQILCCEEKLIY